MIKKELMSCDVYQLGAPHLAYGRKDASMKALHKRTDNDYDGTKVILLQPKDAGVVRMPDKIQSINHAMYKGSMARWTLIAIENRGNQASVPCIEEFTAALVKRARNLLDMDLSSSSKTNSLVTPPSAVGYKLDAADLGRQLLRYYHWYETSVMNKGHTGYLFVILPDRLKYYEVIKKFFIERGVATQIINPHKTPYLDQKETNENESRSHLDNLVLQMNYKLGGITREVAWRKDYFSRNETVGTEAFVFILLGIS